MASAYEKIRGNTLEQNDTLIYLLEFQWYQLVVQLWIVKIIFNALRI
jgi:hypothetical protein